jgi:hypothetical protein
LINLSKESWDLIAIRLEAEPFLKYEYNDCLSPKYTIPSLILYMVELGGVENEVSYEILLLKRTKLISSQD